MKHIVEPLFVSHCVLVQYCFLSFVSIIFRHLCPLHQVRAKPSGNTGDSVLCFMSTMKNGRRACDQHVIHVIST